METKLLVINVLSPEVYQDCHIKNSVNVPLTELEAYVKHLERDTPIVVYCAHCACKSSHNAWHILQKLGFTQIWAYEGGMNEWYQGGFSTQGPCNMTYLKEQFSAQSAEQDPLMRTITAQELAKMISRYGL